jgi:hypothetical protein
MVSLAVCALGSYSWALGELFGGVITGALNATLLQVPKISSMSVTLAPEALKLPLRCPVIFDSDSEIADSG